MSNDQDHLYFLRLALLEAEKCQPTPTAFCVGCVLVARWDNDAAPATILSTGFSRELEGNTHAEANALDKAYAIPPSELATICPTSFAKREDLSLDDILPQVDVYTTMEPCSIRTSGLHPCADALITAKVRRCIIGVGEPTDFVKCEGAQKLMDAGIEVLWPQGLEDKCLQVARKGRDVDDI